MTIEQRLNQLEADSHPPVDIAPRIYDELERMLKLGELFYDIPTDQLRTAATFGLNTFKSALPSERR